MCFWGKKHEKCAHSLKRARVVPINTLMSRINPLLLGISLDHISDVAILFDRALRCVYLNAAAADVLKISRLDALGKSALDLISAQEGLHSALKLALESRTHIQNHMEFEGKSLDCVNSAVRGHHGRAEYVMGIWRVLPTESKI